MLFVMFTSTFLVGCCKTEKECDLQKKQIYEWRIYTLTEEGGSVLDDFFKESLIPAYNRCNVSVGAFCLYKPEEKDQRYLLFVYPDLMTYNEVRQAVWNDNDFQESARPFFETSAPNPVYSVYETYLCEAFDKIPEMRMPDKSRTLFEYRNYYSPNEDANARKIKMFNDEEIDLFDKVGINSVCYGEILAGTRMPALIYLTWYYDEATRNSAWDAFGKHPDWGQMKSKPMYKNTATNNQFILLSPMPYSQF
jgi:hypothetical protein